MGIDVRIEESWKSELSEEWDKAYFQSLSSFLRSEKKHGKSIYPPGPLIFNAFAKTPFDAVKVVIIGQDPYHGPGQAMGLSFSVPMGIRVPASLKRIYKEINRDLKLPIPEHGDLSKWAEQGVFLLNAMLTVEGGKAGSHQKKGWQSFTDAVIRKISDKKEGVIFMLWGNFAKAKRSLINEEKHLILDSAHPSPLAGNAFSGCAHFSKANAWLVSKGQEEIDWRL